MVKSQKQNVCLLVILHGKPLHASSAIRLSALAVEDPYEQRAEDHNRQCEPDEPITEEVAEPTAEPIAEPVGEPVADAFHRHVDEGFARLSEKDWNGAREQWSAALKIRPNDVRLKANLSRLERMKEE